MTQGRVEAAGHTHTGANVSARRPYVQGDSLSGPDTG